MLINNGILETKEPQHGQQAHVLECLSLRLRAQALVNNALRVQLDGVLIKAKALLHNARQLANALAVLACTIQQTNPRSVNGCLDKLFA